MTTRDLSVSPWNQWNYTRNQDLDPSSFTDGSNVKVWWVCERKHEWQTKINLRAISGTGCPVCAGQKVLAGFNDLETTHPDVARQWLQSKNDETRPDQISGGSEKKFWWACDLGHEWEATAANRTRNGSSCAVCSGKKAWAGFNDLESLFPELVTEWSDKNDQRPDQIVPGSGKVFWWKCVKGHEWQQRASVRTRLGTGCPVCSNQKIIPGINDLETLEPEIADEWHATKNGTLLASQVSVGSDKKRWWQCVRGHEWEAAISSRRRNGCPICGNRKLVEGLNDLSTTNPEIATQWHPTKNGLLSPKQVALGQILSVWWLCEEGHEWKATLDTRKQSGCPRCAKYGFSQDGVSELYFIENERLGAWKVGITGVDRVYDRLDNFSRRGWTVITRLQADGRSVMAAEKAMLRWIRKDLGLPQYLDQASMGKHGGASETFTIIYGLKEGIVQRMKLELRKAIEREK